MMRLNRDVMLVGLVAVASLSVACGSSNDTEDCNADIRSAAQTGNTFVAQGLFQGGQPMLRLTQGTATYYAPPITNGASSATFDVSGIPKGVYTANWGISCNDENANGTVESDVPTITIK